jgi:protoporphyrinogen oxidase
LRRDGDPVEVLILGAGLAGLSTAFHLRRPYRLLEKSDRVGGLCKTEHRDGFSFDATGHWLHLRDPTMRKLAEETLPGGWLTVARRAAVYSCGVFTRFPYQINTHGLPQEVVAENVLGFIEAHFGERGRPLRERPATTFGDFIRRQLGEGFARNFMFPYNEKLWTVHPDQMGVEWMGRFVPRPTLEQVVRGAMGLEGDGAGYNATFLYPARGGIEAFAAALGRRLPQAAECGVHPTAIDPDRREVALSSGETVRYRRLVSTIALPELVRLCQGAPDAVREAAGRLRAVTVTYVNVAAREVGAPPFHWVYLPEKRFRPYRVGSASAAVPSLAPAGYRSFYVELSGRAPIESATAEPIAVETLLAMGMIRMPADVLFTETRTIPGAYVLYDADYGPARETIAGWLTARGIHTAGRYGRWEYSSMEDALLGGRECAGAVNA